MNSESSKINTTLSSNSKNLIAARLKRPSRQLSNVVTSTKKPFLKQYSAAMEQKLQNLKQKINEKKKQKNKQQPLKLDQKATSHLEKFIKTNKIKPQKTIQSQLIKQQFSQFLQKHNLSNYRNLLIQNQIDSLQILQEATQKQLQEIGIPKGHTLKIKVNIGKYLKKQNENKFQQLKKQQRDQTTKDSNRNTINVIKNQELTKELGNQNSVKLKIESISIGTQEEQIQEINLTKPTGYKQLKSKFCLFCYQSIKAQEASRQNQFCSDNCEDRYIMMFKKYQNNLIRAEQQFANQQKQKEQILERSHQASLQSQSQKSEQFDLLGNFNEFQGFNYQQYEQVKRQLSLQ